MRRFPRTWRAFSISWEADALSLAGVRLGRNADRFRACDRRLHSGRLPRSRTAGARGRAREPRHRSGIEGRTFVRNSAPARRRLRQDGGIVPQAFSRARPRDPAVSGGPGDACRSQSSRSHSRHRYRKEPRGPDAGPGQYGVAAFVCGLALRRAMRIEACARHAFRAHGGTRHGRGQYPYDRRHSARSSDGGTRRGAGGRGESRGAPQGRAGRARAPCLPGEYRGADAMARSERVICSSADLTDSGDGVRFELEVDGRPEPAFAVRYRGRVYAYVNRCAHMPMELDWKPGKFFDVWGLHLICSTHGATYAPDTGRCLRGPCFEEGLIPVPVEERDGRVIMKGDPRVRR